MIISHPLTYQNYLNRFQTVWGWWRNLDTRTGFRVIIPPRQEPITLAQAAMHLRLDTYGSPAEYPEQLLIEAQISAAREYCERYLGRALAPQTIEWAAHDFPHYDYIELPFGPVLAVETILYYSSDVAEELPNTEFLVDTFCEPARIYTMQAATWPTLLASRPGGVRIRYQAGYTLPSDSPDTLPLPFSLRAAILLVLGHLYANRENTTMETLQDIPLGARSLMDPYRLRLGMA